MSHSKSKIDVLIVGAGFAGLVTAERLTSQMGLNCVVVEKRSHLGGNAYDALDELGVLTHKYGPHYFRSNSERIVNYLSQFTDWHAVDYKIKSHTKGRSWSFPINLKTFEQFIGRSATSEEFEAWLEENREQIENPSNSEEVILSQVGREFYELFFEGYTLKHWKRHPRDLDASVCGRIPIRTNRDDRYLREKFQALPKDGYTALFERMVAASPGLEIKLNTDFQTARTQYEYDHLVYTGPIDEYFEYQFGPLPYRSLKFQHESFSAEQLEAEEREKISGKSGYWQEAMQVNYPDPDVAHTRIVEIKHATGQKTGATSIVKEFPEDWELGKEPYYPVPAPDAAQQYKKYAELAAKEERVSFIGRLATYRYYNMDQVVGMALAEFEKIRSNIAFS